MMIKVTFLGAGSTVFAKNVLGDIMLCEALRDADIALYDIDGERLEDSLELINALNRDCNEGRARVRAYLGVDQRRQALDGADFVVNAIQVGGYDPCTILDFEIPKKYGLRQTIGDTMGIGGIMRALRTIPVLEEFAQDMEKVCPDALFLNYTNPMAMLTGYMQRYTGMQDGRPLPQRTGMLGSPFALAGHGGPPGGPQGADRRYQSHGLAAGDQGSRGPRSVS